MLKTASINEYSRMTNLSRPMIEKMIKEGTLRHTKTEGGGKTLIIYEVNDEIVELKSDVENIQILLKRLCHHLGVAKA